MSLNFKNYYLRIAAFINFLVVAGIVFPVLVLCVCVCPVWSQRQGQVTAFITLGGSW